MEAIKKMSIKEISDKYGYTRYIGKVLDVGSVKVEDYSKVQMLADKYLDNYQKLFLVKDNSEKTKAMNEINSVLEELEPFIDKRMLLYVLLIENVRMIREATKAMHRGEYVQGQDILKQDKSEEMSKLIENEDLLFREDIKFPDKTLKAKIETSDDKLGHFEVKKGLCTRAERRYEEIKSKIEGFDDKILAKIWPSQLHYICRYPNLGYILQEKIVGGFDENAPMEPDKKYSEENYKRGTKYPVERLVEYIKANISYMNIDKLLIISLNAATNDLFNNSENVSKKEVQEWLEIARKIDKFVPANKREIDQSLIGKIDTITEIIKKLEITLKSFINDKALPLAERISIRKKMLMGELPYDYVKPEDYANLAFSERELLIIGSYNKKAFEFFRENHILESKLIDGLDSSEKLVELYMKKDNSQEDEQEFIRFRKIFTMLAVDGKTDEEKTNLSYEIIDQNKELEDEDRLKELYKLGLITCDALIDLIGKSELTKLIENQLLKPADVKKLYSLGTIKKEDVLFFISKSYISSGDKLAFIFSAFCDKEDFDLRNQFISCITNLIKNTKHVSSSIGEINPNPTPGNPTIKYTYDPCTRWRFLKELDPNYSQEYLEEDGHFIFFLPNTGTYVIEKMFDTNTKNGVPRIAYGAATYILDESEFNANKDDIIVNGRINRNALIQLNKNNKAEKLVHKNWANGICRYFGIETNSKYTEEQKKIIQDLAYEVEDSRTQI